MAGRTMCPCAPHASLLTLGQDTHLLKVQARDNCLRAVHVGRHREDHLDNPADKLVSPTEGSRCGCAWRCAGGRVDPSCKQACLQRLQSQGGACPRRCLRIVPTLSVPGKVSHFTATRLARCCQGEEALECPVTNARLLLHPLHEEAGEDIASPSIEALGHEPQRQGGLGQRALESVPLVSCAFLPKFNLAVDILAAHMVE
ncbi:hypothetical protein DMC30DRAFT_405792 [Rhodotorula diobovata]|uniref:Uncharacterized protein n=1 Tax=Rhodotorula diobovata TaxID=5288 RepID=A0A5C5FMD7_9BASI|nr:hypothetical protein DMC30DRAFT_405792 [Rhodotorula diobovata]